MALGDLAVKLNVPVFACKGNKSPVTENGFKNAVTDPARILAMFERPGAELIGMPTGAASGLVVIDIDIRADRTGMDWLQLNADALPETRTHKTRSGGLHLLFKAPADISIRNSTSRIAPGVDVRGDGGYVILPPSPGYEIADHTDPAEMPRWLIRACLPPEAVQAPPLAPQPPRADGGSPYGLKALGNECDRVASARWGEQETTLNTAALKIGALVAGGELQEGIAIADLLSAARGMASEPGREPWKPADVDAKVRRAFRDGQSAPRQAPPRQSRSEPEPPPLDDDPAYWQALEADALHHATAGMTADEWEDLKAQAAGEPTPALPEMTDQAADLLLWKINQGWEEADIEPRRWIAKGYLMRGAVTVVSGPGSAGKSSLMVAWSSCMALGCAFQDFKVPGPMKVGIYNVEDDAMEQKRRFSAMAQMLHTHVKAFMPNLTILGPANVGTLLYMAPDGRRMLNTPVMDALTLWIETTKPDVLILDPFVELHAQEENDNTAIRAVMANLRTLAATHSMAVVILHHARKGETTPGDPDSLRGASSIVGAARIVLTLNVMTKEEAESFNVSLEHRRDYFRLDGAKSNYAPLEEAEWFQRSVRDLANSDGVAVAWPWKPPSVWKDMTPQDIAAALDRIAAGPTPGILYAPTNRGANNSRWVGNPIMQILGLNEQQAYGVVKTWLRNGLLTETTYRDPASRKDVKGVVVDRSKAP